MENTKKRCVCGSVHCPNPGAVIVSLDDWMGASIDQRSLWLQNPGFVLDCLGARVLDWGMIFRDCGALLSDAVILRVYRAIKEMN
jgi:hypothetical protein